MLGLEEAGPDVVTIAEAEVEVGAAVGRVEAEIWGTVLVRFSWSSAVYIVVA